MALKEPRSFGGRDRRRLAIHVLVLVSAAFVLVVGLNVFTRKLLVRYPFLRADLTEVKIYSLSEPTRSFLERQDPGAKIYAIYKRTPGRGTAASHLQRVEALAFGRVLNLLDEYRLLAPAVEYELVDVDRDPVRAQEIAKRLDLRPVRPEEWSRLVVVSGERRRDLLLREMVTLNPGSSRSLPSVASFRAEDAITSALIQVAVEAPPRVYFLFGHGEGDPESENEREGWSEAGTLLERAGLEVRTLDLARRGEVPGDAAAIVVAGPRADLGGSEAAALARYLARGGRALFLLDPEVAIPTIEELLAGFNLDPADPDVVAIDKSQFQLGRRVDHLDLSGGVTRYHPITEPIAAQRLRLSLTRTRPILEVLQDSTLMPVSLLKLSPDGFGARLLPGRRLGGLEVELDEEHDLTSQDGLDVGVAVEAPGSSGTARLVVLGNSALFSNALIDYGPGNAHLLVNIANWLVERDFDLGIPSNSDLDRTIALTRENDRRFLALFVGGLPALALALGLVTFLVRRR